jgi:N-acetylglucosaminyl-diphospho-decaprenol L-rhamnosyltransferase
MVSAEDTLQDARISISIVIHHQAQLVQHLLTDFRAYCSNAIEVLLTLNVKENLPFRSSDFDFPLRVMINSKPKGFGANHNAAFAQSESPYFCVMNPDIRLMDNPFPPLINCCSKHDIGVVAPLIVDPLFKKEDSARRLPTPISILKKALFFEDNPNDNAETERIDPDWVAGMFMLFARERFKAVGGFNEKYFLYYEDVDLCARFFLSGYQVVLCPTAKVIHEAQRTSHRNFKYFSWHLSSALRFFTSKVFFDALMRKRSDRMQLTK